MIVASYALSTYAVLVHYLWTFPAPSLLELPPHVFESVCVSLDSGSVHNWRSLVDHLKDYTIMDVRQLNHVEQRVSFLYSSNFDRAFIYYFL